MIDSFVTTGGKALPELPNLPLEPYLRLIDPSSTFNTKTPSEVGT